MRTDWIEKPAPPESRCFLTRCGKRAIAVFVPANRPGYMPFCEEHLAMLQTRRPELEVREVRW